MVKIRLIMSASKNVFFKMGEWIGCYCRISYTYILVHTKLCICKRRIWRCYDVYNVSKHWCSCGSESKDPISRGREKWNKNFGIIPANCLYKMFRSLTSLRRNSFSCIMENIYGNRENNKIWEMLWVGMFRKWYGEFL